MTKRHPRSPNSAQKRPPVPTSVQRTLFLECGFKCPVPRCHAADGLEFHHINGNRSDNSEGNLLVLCHEHHVMAHRRRSRLDRKACQALKQGVLFGRV